ncbi:hypothetical protein AVEN_239968-1 [Araneus ventricosus]|uniref:Uncharacterized protein n=1 Tax=Araneus ventricosus TaxID=182803 RepID=A0A4Y2UA52_ARAVE|nr:hypothetical protein AVEN_239968-1 [Araneus ventricosus]
MQRKRLSSIILEGCDIFLIASVFVGSGHIPSADMMCPNLCHSGVLQDSPKLTEHVVLRKNLRTSEGIHDWFTRRNNRSFVHNLGFIFQIQNSERNGFPIEINECGRHEDTFLENLKRKVSYGISEMSRNFRNSLDKAF